MISARGLVKTFDTGVEQVHAVSSVDLEVGEGEFVCLYGASGSGKSTLLALVGGLLSPDQGEVSVGGRSLVGMSEDARADLRLETVGMVFQGDNVIMELTAAENVMLPLLARQIPPLQARTEALAALEPVGIADLADRSPREMSGGQRQRVGIARALVGDRRILLADEPTGALDSVTSRELFTLIRRLCDERGCTALVATHDPLGHDHAGRVMSMIDGKIDEGNA